MKNCCKKAIENYKRNKGLSELQENLKKCIDLKRDERENLFSFIEGMKIN